MCPAFIVGRPIKAAREEAKQIEKTLIALSKTYQDADDAATHRVLTPFSQFLAVRRKACEEHSSDSGDEDAVECSRSAD